MGKKKSVSEQHRSGRIGWLRASVLGANDGVISTASLLVGIAAANFAREDLLIAGFASLVAGAMSMAAGEYVSVSSQADTEKADLAQERYELETNVEFEREELTKIYIDRGLDPELAKQVSQQLMDYDALEAHARDELGIFPSNSAQPLQAALASASFFSIGAAIPLLIAVIVPAEIIIPAVSGASLIFLTTLGALAARVGGSSMWKGAIRVTFWGTLAMALTTGIGILHGGPV